MLARRTWNSLVVVPASPEDTTDDLVQSLALVGKQLGLQAVTGVSVKALGPSSAAALTTLAHHVRNRQLLLQRRSEILEGPFDVPIDIDPAPYGLEVPDRLILGVPSVLAEPVGLSITSAVDAVVLALEIGKTSKKEVRQSIEKIGREKIIGACLL